MNVIIAGFVLVRKNKEKFPEEKILESTAKKIKQNLTRLNGKGKSMPNRKNSSCEAMEAPRSTHYEEAFER